MTGGHERQRDAIVALRETRGWSQAVLALASGIPLARLDAIERGTVACDPLTGDALIRAFVRDRPDLTWLVILCAGTFACQAELGHFLLHTPVCGEA